MKENRNIEIRIVINGIEPEDVTTDYYDEVERILDFLPCINEGLDEIVDSKDSKEDTNWMFDILSNALITNCPVCALQMLRAVHMSAGQDKQADIISDALVLAEEDDSWCADFIYDILEHDGLRKLRATNFGGKEYGEM